MCDSCMIYLIPALLHRDFLIRCVRETNRRLLDECLGADSFAAAEHCASRLCCYHLPLLRNRQLKSTLQDYLASCALEEASRHTLSI